MKKTSKASSKTQDAAIRWIVVGFSIALALFALLRARNKAKLRELEKEQAAREASEKLEKSLRDLGARVSELSRGRI